MKLRTIQWINTIAFAVMVLINILANIIPFGIGDTAYISQKYSSLFTPAGFTFSIWAVIYVFMLMFVLYQWGIIDDRSDKVTAAIGPGFFISCVLNIAWIFAWHFDIIWMSVLIIIALLVTLVMIKAELDKVRKVGTYREVVDVGFDIYLGWITAATIANISIYFVSIGWAGFGISKEVWTSIVLIVGALIGLAYTAVSGRIFSTLAVGWAYVGILSRHISGTLVNVNQTVIIVCALVGEIIMLAGVIYYLALKSSPQVDCDKCRFQKSVE